MAIYVMKEKSLRVKVIDDPYTLKNNEFEIDPLMIPAIKEFNKKGYKTNFCCSGHIPNNNKIDNIRNLLFRKFYVLFDEDYEEIKELADKFVELVYRFRISTSCPYYIGDNDVAPVFGCVTMYNEYYKRNMLRLGIYNPSEKFVEKDYSFVSDYKTIYDLPYEHPYLRYYNYYAEKDYFKYIDFLTYINRELYLFANSLPDRNGNQ